MRKKDHYSYIRYTLYLMPDDPISSTARRLFDCHPRSKGTLVCKIINLYLQSLGIKDPSTVSNEDMRKIADYILKSSDNGEYEPLTIKLYKSPIPESDLFIERKKVKRSDAFRNGKKKKQDEETTGKTMQETLDDTESRTALQDQVVYEQPAVFNNPVKEEVESKTGYEDEDDNSDFLAGWEEGLSSIMG